MYISITTIIVIILVIYWSVFILS